MLRSRGAQLMAIAIAALIVDWVIDVPSPPGWLISWTGWAVVAFALIAGPGMIREAIARKSPPPSGPGST